jgi:hypothetical protein
MNETTHADPTKPAPETPENEAPMSPAWMLPGMIAPNVKPELLRAVEQIVEPVYEKLVARAKDPLKRATAVTVVQVLWLELLEQVRFAHLYNRQYVSPEKIDALVDSASKYCQRLVETKVKAGVLLQKVREFAYRRNRDAREALAAANAAARAAERRGAALLGFPGDLDDEPGSLETEPRFPPSARPKGFGRL